MNSIFDLQNSSRELFATLEAAFHPRAIAVVGASDNSGSFGYHFLRFLLQAGYRGKIYPVNPHKQNILGLKGYPRLSEIPEPVDYVICCVNASQVEEILRECPARGVKVVHLFTGRLSETGRAEAQRLEQEILRQARESGVRLIGPNSMGLYYPRQGIAFNYDLPMEPGSVGAIFQSGGIAGEFVRHAGLRGVRFSKVISYGNAVDLNESDFLEYFFHDPETKIIAVYIEGVREAPRFLATLRRVARTKPVLVLKGGKSEAGSRATVSHTASIAGSFGIWEVALRQSRAVQAADLEELVDLVTAFSFLPPLFGRRVGVIGGGGGKNVLAADECERAGLEVVSLPAEIRDFLRERDPLLEKWLGNPVDRSVLDWSNVKYGEMLEMMARSPHFDFLLCNLSDDVTYGEDQMVSFIEKEIGDYVKVAGESGKPLVVIVGNPLLAGQDLSNWRWQMLAGQRKVLISAGIPVFASASQAARALGLMIDYYQRVGIERKGEESNDGL